MPNKTQSEQGLLARFIAAMVARPFWVALVAVLVLGAGLICVPHTPLDAIPDLTDTQVIVRTDYPGQAPQVVEDQVTYPLTTQLLGLPGAKVVRGYSMFGTSFVYILFKDGIDPYWARSRVSESLSQAAAQLPQGVAPQLGPDATGVGWVYQYALVDKTGQHDLAQLRTLQDWFLKLELTAIDGVAEVASVGGFVKEYQIMLDPNRLRAYDVPLTRVLDAVRNASQETGGRTLELAEGEYMIRSHGYADTLADLRETVVFSRNGSPVTLGNLARVQAGPALRRGMAELNGEGEAVGGIVIMRPGANALQVTEAVKKRLAALQPGLPSGVTVVPVYDRGQLIRGAVHYLSRKLVEEALIVVLVCFVFLLHARSALVALVSLPLGVLSALLVMYLQGITVNIMSLGGIAIAIGAMVDAGIVMVENAHRHLAALPDDAAGPQRRAVILQAAQEVGPGIFFSLLIITVSFIPVFALGGEAYKLFSPLAFTKTYAMAAAAILSVTLVPVMMVWLLRGRMKAEDKNPLNRFFMRLYQPVLERALAAKKAVVIIAGVLILSCLLPLWRTGTEFMPPLNEGSLLYMPMTLPGVSPAEARHILQVTDKLIKQTPEVELVFGKAGRAETATDPAPLAMLETWVKLKPKAQWRRGMTMEKLINELDKNVRLPGLMNSWGYPIKTRLDMLSTGIRTPVGIKIAGPDLAGIDAVAQQVEHVLKGVPGTRSAIADRVVGGKYIEIEPNRRELARYGIDLATVQLIIRTALGGMELTQVVQGRERYGVMVRYARPFRETLADLDNILVPTPEGAHIPLAQVARIRATTGPATIKSENARLNGWVFVDIKGRALANYVADARRALAKQVSLPAGYSLTFAGQFAQLQAAQQRLQLAVPAAVLTIILLLYLYFADWPRVILLLLALPFAMTGGLWAVYLAGYHFSVAVAVGFIALAGVAVETAIVMLLYLDQQAQAHPPRSAKDIRQVVIAGAALRLRPKLMTVFTIVGGLIPVFLTTGPGSDVMRRIALPMVGGMLSTTVLVLLLLPVLYAGWLELQLKKRP